MKILELRAENFKRLSVVEITPQGHVVEITGKNGAGKTTVLDSIWAVLGGKNAIPEQPIRLGHEAARIQVKLGDEPGAPILVVERRFTPKDSYIKVTDPDGAKHSKPETILKGLMGEIGFDPLGFTRMKPSEQYDVLRRLVKFDVDIDALNRKRATLFEERQQIGRDLKRAEGAAAEITVPTDLPEEAPDLAVLTEKLAAVDAHNALIRQMQFKRDQLIIARTHAASELGRAKQSIADLESELQRAKEIYARLEGELEESEIQRQEAGRLVDEAGELLDPQRIAGEISRARKIEQGFALQRQKIDANARVSGLQREYSDKTSEIDEIDVTKQKVIGAAKMPIEGLSFVDESVQFKGLPLSAASAAEQLRISAAIGAALNPKLRVLLVRDGSLLDSGSLAALAEFAAATDMQVWLEKVDESGEVGVVLVDGHVKGQEELVEAFERSETEQTGEVVDHTKPQVVDDARMQRVHDYIAEKLATIDAHVTARDLAGLDRENAEVKVKLQNFPELIQTKWAPAYLEAVRAIRK